MAMLVVMFRGQGFGYNFIYILNGKEVASSSIICDSCVEKVTCLFVINSIGVIEVDTGKS